MASLRFSSSFPCLAGILVWAIFNMNFTGLDAIPYTGVQAQTIVRREADMTTQSALEVQLGLSVMQRFIDINLERLPFELYGGQDTKVHERGLLGFAQLYRYTQMFTALQKLGFNTTELTLFKLLTKEILTDACNWIDSYSSTRINCSNPSEFVTLLIAVGLNPHINQLDSYMEVATDGILLEVTRKQSWVNKTITGDYEQLRCPFCTEINLKHCCA